MDWTHWTPQVHAVLCFIVREGQVLLIHKQRGLGAGKVNAPGGKLEPGETPLQAAVRETQEEIGVTPLHLTEAGTLRFQFTDGLALFCTVFRATDFTGTPIPTAEAIPFWSPVAEVPYGAMWEDDQYWLPHFLAGRPFTAGFEFEGERMLSQHVEILPRRLLIAGCGYLGVAVGRLMSAEDWHITACTHTAESAAQLTTAEGWPTLPVDLGEPESVATLQAHGPFTAVLHCASSGRGGAEAYRRVYLQGMQHLAACFPAAHLLFTSSTSVYAQTEGAPVTEASPATPPRETGQLLRAAEAVALQAGGTVARLAGLYGPGRSVLLRKYLSGEAVIEGDGQRWLNQIHRDDAARALALLLSGPHPGVFNVADGTPLTQRDLYAGLAQRLGGALPPTGPVNTDRKRGWTHKQVLAPKLQPLGWRPRYPSFFTAVEEDPELVPAAQAAC